MNTTLLTATGYGRPIGLRVPSADVAEARTWLPWWWQDDDSSPEEVWEADSAAECESVVRWIELWVAEHAVDRIFVHAGVVYVGDAALLLPGRSFAGKSTLVAALLERGALYGSDEYAVISADGLVHPYPRPVTTREMDGSRTRAPVLAARIGGPAPVSLVAHLHYDAGVEPSIATLASSQSVLRLLDNTVAAQARTEEALSVLTTAAGNAAAVEGARGSAGTTAEALMDMVP